MSETKGFLLDTNVISETHKKWPNERFLATYSGLKNEELFLSVLTVGELRKGVARKRRIDASDAGALSLWVDGLEQDLADRILPVDLTITELWGELSSDRTRPVVDTLLAATAIVHGLTLVTRNVTDRRDLPVKLLNPWEA